MLTMSLTVLYNYEVYEMPQLNNLYDMENMSLKVDFLDREYGGKNV